MLPNASAFRFETAVWRHGFVDADSWWYKVGNKLQFRRLVHDPQIIPAHFRDRFLPQIRKRVVRVRK